MFLSRRGSIYYLWYTDATGKRRKVSTKSKTKSAALVFTKGFQPKGTSPEKQDPNFSIFVVKFLEFCRSTLQPGTCELYRLAFNSFERIIGDRSLRSITPYDIDVYKSKLLKEIRAVTVNMRLSKLKAAFNTAKRWGQIEKNPFEGVSMVNVPETIPIHVSKEEFQILYRGIKERWLREVVLWAVLTGMRRGEIINLRWNQVDLSKKTVIIQTSPTYRTKMGRKRVVPMSDEAFALLTRKKMESANHNDFIFTLNNRPLNEDWVTHKFKKYVKELLPNNTDVHFHSLRATFATLLVMQGTSLYEIQKLLGHSSIILTQTYSHLAPNDLHSTVNRIALQIDEY